MRGEVGDGSGRGLALLYWTAQFRAAGLALLGLVALFAAGIAGFAPDGLLMLALASLAAVSLLARSLVRRHRMAGNGGAMAVALLLAALPIAVLVQRTGVLLSPLVLVQAALIAFGALTLAPLAHMVALSGVCLLQTLIVMATAEGLLPPGPFGNGGTGPFSLLFLELGLFLLLGYLVNALSWRIREQLAELAGRDLRDPATGLLRRGIFHARLVALLEGLERDDPGLALLIVDLGTESEALLNAVSTRLVQAVGGGEDLVGRIGYGRFGVALPGATEEMCPRVARRLLHALDKLGIAQVGIGQAHIESPGAGDDPLACARRLFARAEATLEQQRATVAA